MLRSVGYIQEDIGDELEPKKGQSTVQRDCAEIRRQFIETASKAGVETEHYKNGLPKYIDDYQLVSCFLQVLLEDDTPDNLLTLIRYRLDKIRDGRYGVFGSRSNPNELIDDPSYL